jgi:hypothetical protein
MNAQAASQKITAPRRRPSVVQRQWLSRGVGQPGGKLPLFDSDGQTFNAQTIKACVREGWAEPWMPNPIKPDWLVCRLTDAGREAISAGKKPAKT